MAYSKTLSAWQIPPTASAMEDTHLAFGGQMSPNQSFGDLGDMSLDFDALMASGHQQLSQGLEAIVGNFNHDDSCLDPQGLISCSHVKKPGSDARRFSKKSLSNRSSRAAPKGNPPQTHSRDRHSISDSAPHAFFQASQAPLYPWETLFNDNMNDNIMDTSQLFSFNDKLIGDARESQPKLNCNEDCASIMSCSSACGASCPSQCGEIGQAVCCDDDECGDQDLCLDDACLDTTCQDAYDTCTATHCLRRPNAPSSNLQPVISDGDKQAAAALASFGENQLSFMNQDLSQFGSHSHSQFPRGGDLMYSELSDGNFSLNEIFNLANADGSNGQFREHVNPENLLATHLLQYHNPRGSVNHVRPCIADRPNWSHSRCTLPKATDNSGLGSDALHQDQEHLTCGVEIDTMDQFANHLFEDHRQIPLYNLDSFHLPCSSHAAGDFSHHMSVSPSDIGKPAYGLEATSRHATHFSPSDSSVPNLSVISSVPPSPASSVTTPLAHSRLSTEPKTMILQSPLATPSQPHTETEQDYCCRWVLEDGAGICGMKFKDSDDLHRHARVDHLITQKRGNNCCAWENCNRTASFNQKSKLERHLQTHTGFKPVKCTVCGLQLSAKQALEQHMRIHTGEKPWKCKFPGCTHAFKQQSALTMHERTHTGYRPLVCDICNKKFGESSNLSKHRRTHNTTGIHVCRICNKDFHRLDQLRRHLQSNHKCKPEEVDSIIKQQRKKEPNEKQASPS